MQNYTKNDLVCQCNIGHKIWGAVPIFVVGRESFLFVKLQF